MLTRNVFANLIGGIWVAVLTLAIAPIQVYLLGVEAYGVIGFISTLQVVVGVLDLGLSSTLTREIAGDRTPDRRASRDLVRTSVTIYWALAALSGAAIVLLADPLAHRWFNPDTIDIDTLERALQVGAIYLASRWPVVLYTGVISGSQRMDVLNTVKIGAVTVRLVGGIIVLIVWPQLTFFLWWLGISSIIEVAAYLVAARRVMPDADWRPGLSLEALRTVWSFSLQMAALALLSMVLTQVDRLMISKMLPLKELGYYSLAYTAATGISLVISSVSTALMPSFAAAHEAGEREPMLVRYEAANRAMLFSTGLVLFSLAFFGRPLLSLWVSPAAATGAWVPLALLAGGFWFSAAVSNAYTSSIALRRPSGPLLISAATAVLYVPLMYGMVRTWGINGAAGAWLVLNACYVVTIIPFVHWKVLRIAVAPWFLTNLIPFACLGLLTFGLARALLALWGPSGIAAEVATLVAAAATYSLLGYTLLGETLKTGLQDILRRRRLGLNP